MTSEMEEILRRVAAGELSPQEALPLIDAAKREAAANGEAGGAGDSAPPAPGSTAGSGLISSGSSTVSRSCSLN